MSTKKTLAQKIWDNHTVHKENGIPDLLFIDLHLIHEVTSPQAFESLRINNRKVRRPDLSIATIDHNVPTTDRTLPNPDPLSIKQIDALRENAKDFNIPLFDIFDPRQGIVHVISPEQGLTQPGMTIVCGDSHTSTHGAFGSLAFGIGTSEVEHVLATQTLPAPIPKMMQVHIKGRVNKGITGKDSEKALGLANITVNKNAVPNDPQSPFVTSGIRLGTPAITTRGFKQEEIILISNWICDVILNIENEEMISSIKNNVIELCKKFPVYNK